MSYLCNTFKLVKQELTRWDLNSNTPLSAVNWWLNIEQENKLRCKEASLPRQLVLEKTSWAETCDRSPRPFCRLRGGSVQKIMAGLFLSLPLSCTPFRSFNWSHSFERPSRLIFSLFAWDLGFSCLPPFLVFSSFLFHPLLRHFINILFIIFQPCSLSWSRIHTQIRYREQELFKPLDSSRFSISWVHVASCMNESHWHANKRLLNIILIKYEII